MKEDDDDLCFEKNINYDCLSDLVVLGDGIIKIT